MLATSAAAHVGGDMRLILAWLRSGYTLFVRKGCGAIVPWMDAPSPRALALDPAAVARLIDARLIEEDEAAATERQSVYVLTDTGRRASR